MSSATMTGIECHSQSIITNSSFSEPAWEAESGDKDDEATGRGGCHPDKTMMETENDCDYERMIFFFKISEHGSFIRMDESGRGEDELSTQSWRICDAKLDGRLSWGSFLNLELFPGKDLGAMAKRSRSYRQKRQRWKGSRNMTQHGSRCILGRKTQAVPLRPKRC